MRLPLRDLVIDTWSALTHKAMVADADRYNTLLPTWLTPEQQRRLAAYRTLAAYQENVARYLLQSWTSAPDTESDALIISQARDDERMEYREYGDAALLVQRVVAGVLGDSMSIDVEGANDELPDMPPLPDPPDDLPDDADDIARRIHAIRQTQWTQAATRAIDSWEQALLAQPELQARQEWLRDWADTELLEQVVWEGEGDAVGLGDGVYALSWSSSTRRVRVHVYPPDAYMPVLDDDADRRGYPGKLHLAWEFTERDQLGRDQVYVRRITWELVPLVALVDGQPVRTADGLMQGATRAVQYQDEPATETCLLTDATWKKPDVDDSGNPQGPFSGGAVYARNEDGEELNRLDLGIDFIPVIHVPNTPAQREHFGRSVLSRVLQLLDDIASTDTDLQAAAALAGTPMAALSGSNLPGEVDVRPGLIVGVGTDGRMDVIDLSASVVALQGVVNLLLDRFQVNSQVPGEVTGRVTDTGPESGFARQLKLGPYAALIAVLRLVRVHKYRLLLKFVQRLAIHHGALTGPVVDARLIFGSFMPSDQRTVIELVVRMLEAHAISRRTALEMLVAVGVPIEDANAELDAIQHEDFTGAAELFTAAGDDDAVRRYLGLPADDGRGDEPPPQPEPVLPEPPEPEPIPAP